MTNAHEWRAWVLESKLRTVLSLWAVGIAGSLAYQATRPIPTSLKIIHSRVYAQALTLAAVAGMGVVEFVDHRGEETPPRVR